MDILREIGMAEKAGSGFDKIFTDLLKSITWVTLLKVLLLDL